MPARKNSNVNKAEIPSRKSLLKELPFYNFTGCLVILHGQFNNSLSNHQPTKNDLQKLTSLYDLNLFDLNVNLDSKLSCYENLLSHKLQVDIFPHIVFIK